jgi:hypothetical protein
MTRSTQPAVFSSSRSHGVLNNVPGDANRAEEMVRSIVNPSVQALSVIAMALAEIGELDEARRIILSIPDSSKQERALAAAVETGARSSDLIKAEAIARSITDPVRQAQALSAVSLAYANRGNSEQAENIARSIANPPRQAQTLAALASSVSPDKARKLLAYALMIGDWQICLTALIRINPDIAAVIADEFFSPVEPQISPIN